MVIGRIGGPQSDSLLIKHLHIDNEHSARIMAMHMDKEQIGILFKH